MRFRHAFAVLAALALTTPLLAQNDVVYRPGDGVTLPAILKSAKPNYTHEAMQQRIEGTVTLDTVVRADGGVGDVTVVKSLDSVYGLDNEAVKAVKQWAFKPGTKDGKPVAVLVRVELSFRLK